MRSSWIFLICVLGAALAAYTQLTALATVPGLHFDEAWQGLLAHRIGTESGFLPTGAMNSYTSPTVHYLLAAAFRFFGSSLTTMRGIYALMNLGSMALMSALLWRLGERLAVAWFIVFWALLPLSVHNHRFYVEATGFHAVCLTLVVWGVALWRRRPVASFLLIAAGTLAGVSAHILFLSVFAGGIFVLARTFPGDFRSRRSQWLIAIIALLIVPLALRMGLGLKKNLPFALALVLLSTAFWALATPRWIRFQSLWQRWPRRAMRLSKFVFFCTLPFLVSFVALLWNGFWPYAQATGYLQLAWLPVNAVLFVMLMVQQLRRPGQRRFAREVGAPREMSVLAPSLMWGSFVACFLITSIIILKQSPRYYMLPAIFAMIWSAQRLARIPSLKLQLALAACFVSWNLAVFHTAYLWRFERGGSNTVEFHAAIFHDNGRDFRPFQKMYEWARTNGCLAAVPWVEDDRFKLPFDFLRLTSGPTLGTCRWKTGDLFFSHIPNYDPNFSAERNEFNTPSPVENVKFLAHFTEWGDLAVWMRR
ncbi:MAG: hypothetical protein HY074_13175 [Deltaproteobacteria bacterium]|nr:hypothetical protein [Deltaproteobacteria bacterium]